MEHSTQKSRIFRELWRPVVQLSDLISTQFSRFKSGSYDRACPSQLKVAAGNISARNKVEILLVYQPKGIPHSLQLTCRHLISKGSAPVIVSNGPLAEADSLALAEVSLRLLERPNLAYDFCGYRDGFHWVEKQENLNPDWLIILNDRIWFPIRDSEAMIARRAAANLTFTGAVWVAGPQRPKAEHYESYFFLIRRDGRHSKALEAERSLLLAVPTADAAWYVAVIDRIRKAAYGHTWYAAFRYATEHFYDLAILKRRIIAHTVAMRRQTLAAIDAGCLAYFLPLIDPEVRASVPKVPQ